MSRRLTNFKRKFPKGRWVTKRPPKLSEDIRGWDILLNRTGRSRGTVDRWIKLYGFPPPIYRREGSRTLAVWTSEKVDTWLQGNNHLVTLRMIRRRKKFIHP